MKKITRMLLIGLPLFALVGCGPYKYDQPKFFGVNQYSWFHMSERQREEAVANQTSRTVKSLNPVCFKGCLKCCIPKDGSHSTGYNHECFNHCLRSCTPVTKEERFNSWPL